MRAISGAMTQKLARMREGVVRLCEGADLVVYDTHTAAMRTVQ